MNNQELLSRALRSNQELLSHALLSEEVARMEVSGNEISYLIGNMPFCARPNRSKKYEIDGIQFWRDHNSFGCWATPETTMYLIKRGFAFDEAPNLRNVYKCIALIREISIETYRYNHPNDTVIA